MSDKPQPFFTLEQRCACGSSLFVECPQETSYSLSNDLVKLATTWTTAHAAHHQEPKK